MPRLDQRQRLDQPLAPGSRRDRRAAPDSCRIAWRALRLGLGINQIGEAFDRGEVELAVLERAAGELARPPPAAIPAACASAANSAAITARPPCRCSSAMSSPVSLFGPGNQSTSASSRIALRLADRAAARSAAWRGSGNFPAERCQRRARAAGRRRAPPRSRRAAGRRRARRWCRGQRPSIDAAMRRASSVKLNFVLHQLAIVSYNVGHENPDRPTAQRSLVAQIDGSRSRARATIVEVRHRPRTADRRASTSRHRSGRAAFLRSANAISSARCDETTRQIFGAQQERISEGRIWPQAVIADSGGFPC